MSLALLERWTIRFTRVVAFLGLVALIVIAVMILTNATMRWLFNSPLTGVRDWEKLIIPIAVASCIPAVMAGRENITIRFLGRWLQGRRQVTAELFGALVALMFLAVLAWQFQGVVGELWKSGETTETIGKRIAPWWQVVAVLFYLSTAVQAVVVVSLAATLIAGRPLEQHSVGDDPTADPKADPKIADMLVDDADTVPRAH
jgi:TRAP-type C4-dicarboxylate transport system permease small subunit